MSFDESLDDLFSDEAISNPATFYARLRQADPVHWNPRWKGWIVTSHADVQRCLASPELSARRFEQVIESSGGQQKSPRDSRILFDLLSGWLAFMDPPQHTRTKRLVSKAFTHRTVSAMDEAIDAAATTLATTIREERRLEGSFDLIADFAFPLPALVVGSLMGVPPQDMLRMKELSADVSTIIFIGESSENRYSRAAQSIEELTEYFASYLDGRKAPTANGLLARLAGLPDVDPLTRTEIISTCVNLLFAGQDTTMNLIGNAVIALATEPESRQAFWRGEVDIDTAIDEFLRLEGPAKTTVRWTREEFQLGDRIIPAGQRLLLVMAGANRDPQVFDHPDEMDLSRHPNPQLSFGQGIHFCLGAPLARAETRAGLKALAQVFPDLHLSGAVRDIEWRRTLVLRGVDTLPVSFDPRVEPLSWPTQ